MKNIKPITLAFLVLFSFVQCQNKEEVITYVVTPEFSKKIDKPEVHFTVDIPKGLIFKKPEEGKKNYSYGMITKENDEKIITQMYSFGHIKIDGMSIEESGKSFMKQVRSMLKNAGFEIENDTIGVFDFDRAKYAALQMIGKMKEGTSTQYVGKYFYNVIAKPNPYGDTHIIMLMTARDDQNIKTYEDFKDKLAISTIWKTFEYLK